MPRTMMTAISINPSERMRTKVITLCLGQIRGAPGLADGIKPTQSGGQSWHRQTL